VTPGIYAIPVESYHADEIAAGGDSLETPTLSASIANILINKSPAHAAAAHPRLNPDLERVESDKFDIGTAAHRLLLEGDNAIDVVDAADWRTAAAKEARATARGAGRIALLPKQAEAVVATTAAARVQLSGHSAQPPLFTDGKPEQTLVWEDAHGVICRARLDWLRDDYAAVDDLKTTSASADPEKWTRTMYGMGGDVQVAFYMRGVERLTGIKPVFRFVVVETYPPYALSVVDLAPSALALADDKVQRAIDLWATCLENDFWPAYPTSVASIEVPTYEELNWLAREQEAAA
jgi:hypothetical protein